MSKEALVIFFGALAGLAPFLGLPGSWRTVLLCICGVVLVSLGVLLRREVLSRGESKGTSFFIDNRAKSEQNVFAESEPRQIQ